MLHANYISVWKEGKENPSTEIGQIFKSLRVFVITDFTILSQEKLQNYFVILSLEKRKQCCYSSSTHIIAQQEKGLSSGQNHKSFLN